MKFTIPHLKKGDVVQATVVEGISDYAFIVNFQGDLIRVTNRTPKPFNKGQELQLKVITVAPLSFQVV